MESEGFDYLDAPVERITGLDVPMAYAISLEVLALPKAKNIINGVHRVLKGVKKNK
jgi:pyruvate dehydrogenase E1 component beta subunit